MKRASTMAVLLVLGLAYTVCAMSTPARAEDREAEARRLYVEAKKTFRSGRCFGLLDDTPPNIETTIKRWEGQKSSARRRNTLLNDYPKAEAAFDIANEGYVTEQGIDTPTALQLVQLDLLIPPPPPPPPPESRPLPSSVIDSIRRQVEEKWAVPMLFGVPQDLSVELRIVLQVNGTVYDVQIIDKERMYRPGEDNFRAMAESAKRAVYRASPLKDVPTESYYQWREIVLVFKPPI